MGQSRNKRLAWLAPSLKILLKNQEEKRDISDARSNKENFNQNIIYNVRLNA
jgi:hypothetical protein